MEYEKLRNIRTLYLLLLLNPCLPEVLPLLTLLLLHGNCTHTYTSTHITMDPLTSLSLSGRKEVSTVGFLPSFRFFSTGGGGEEAERDKKHKFAGAECLS